jgi:RNA polymerase sigma factor (sigma-70 family)
MDDASHRLIIDTITAHADSLLGVARRYTGCRADAEDAYQRALEIFVKNAARLESETVHRWLHTVVKHEALAVRRQRSKLVGVEDDETLDALDDGRHVASVEERSERFEEMARAAEALKRLKPHEVTALMLKAQGLSYSEIAERQGWTYTKVNRCITEGRRAFLTRFADIESGAECERWAPVLSAMADGEATAAQLVDVRPHLRACSACRSVLAGMRTSGAPIAALLPPALAAAPETVVPAGGGILDRLGELFLSTQERVAAPLIKAQAALEVAGSTKVAAVAASAAALAGGGVAADRAADGATTAKAGERPAAVVRAAPDPARPQAAGPEEEPASAPAAVRREPGPQRRQRRRTTPALDRAPAPDAEFAAETGDPAPRAPQPAPPAALPTTRAEPSPPPPPPAAADEFDPLGS